MMGIKYTEGRNIQTTFCRAVFIYIALTCVQMANGAVSISSQHQNQEIGLEYALTCTITPSFTSTATWTKDSVLQATCASSYCSINTSTIFFTYSSNGMTVTFKPLSISNGGLWECTHSSGTANFTVSPKEVTSTTTENTTPDSKDLRVIGIEEGCCIFVDVVVIILLLYENTAILNLFHVVNVADNPRQREMIYVLLFVCAVFLGAHCVVAVIVLPPTVIVYYPYKVDIAVGVSFLLISVRAAIFTIIYWVVIVFECGRRIARFCTNTINNSDLDATIVSTRISINGDVGIRSPVTSGRRLPPLPLLPLNRTDSETPDKKEKKKKKKNKSEINEDGQAKKNNTEMKHEEDDEN